jgi:hypothetical protein
MDFHLIGNARVRPDSLFAMLPNVSVQRPAQAGEARRSGSAATDGY